MLTPGQAVAQPFDPALRDLRINCAAAQFTSSAPAVADALKWCGRYDETFHRASSYQLLHGGDAQTGVGASQLRTVCAGGGLGHGKI
jgi:hypothetical protein